MASTHYRELQLLSEIVKEGDFRSERDEFNLLMRMNDELSTSVENLRCLNDLYCDDQDFAKKKGALEDFIGPELREFTEYSEISEESLGAFTIAAVIVVLGAIIALLVWIISFLSKGGGGGGSSLSAPQRPSRQNAEERLAEELKQIAEDTKNSHDGELEEQFQALQDLADKKDDNADKAEEESQAAKEEEERQAREAEEARRREEEALRQKQEEEVEKARREREEAERKQREAEDERKRKEEEARREREAAEAARVEAERKQEELEKAKEIAANKTDESKKEESAAEAKQILKDVMEETLPEKTDNTEWEGLEAGLKDLKQTMGLFHLDPNNSERIAEAEKIYSEYLRDFHDVLKDVREKLYIPMNNEGKKFAVFSEDGVIVNPNMIITCLQILYNGLANVRDHFKDIKNHVDLFGNTTLRIESDTEVLDKAIITALNGDDKGREYTMARGAIRYSQYIRALDVTHIGTDDDKEMFRPTDKDAEDLPRIILDPLQRIMDNERSLYNKINELTYIKTPEETSHLTDAIFNLIQAMQAASGMNLYTKLNGVFGLVDALYDENKGEYNLTIDNADEVAKKIYDELVKLDGELLKFDDIEPAIGKVDALCNDLKGTLEPILRTCEKLKAEVQQRFQRFEKRDESSLNKDFLLGVLRAIVKSTVNAAEKLRGVISIGLDFVYTSSKIAEGYRNVSIILARDFKKVVDKWEQQLTGVVHKLIAEHLERMVLSHLAVTRGVGYVDELIKERKSKKA